MERRTRIGSLEYVLGPDLLLGVVTGCYVSALVAPAIALVVATAVGSLGGLLALVVLGLALVPLAGWAIVRRDGTVEWVATSKWAWVVPILGGVPIVAYLAPLVLESTPTWVDLYLTDRTVFVALVGGALGFLAALLGGALVSIARHRRISALLDGESVLKWQTNWSSRRRVRYVLGVVVPAYVGIAGTLWLWGPAERGSPSGILLAMQLALAVTFVLSLPTREHTYRVTSAGIERRGPLPPRLYRWDQFDVFSVTDQAIVLHRPSPRLDFRCSRREILENEDTLLRSLEEHLDRID